MSGKFGNRNFFNLSFTYFLIFLIVALSFFVIFTISVKIFKSQKTLIPTQEYKSPLATPTPKAFAAISPQIYFSFKPSKSPLITSTPLNSIRPVNSVLAKITAKPTFTVKPVATASPTAVSTQAPTLAPIIQAPARTINPITPSPSPSASPTIIALNSPSQNPPQPFKLDLNLFEFEDDGNP